jgi:hypothetical protein
MANEKAQESKGWNDATNGAAANADGWEEVAAELQIVLETEGEGFIGRFQGMDSANANGIVQAHFTSVSDLDSNPVGDLCFINATRDLQNKLSRVPIKSLVRAEWVSSLDTGHESGTKMRVFKVQWK